MSYILDALKKSARERQRETLPGILSVHDIVAEKPKKRLVLPYLLAAALVLNAGILIWWLWFAHTKDTIIEPLKAVNTLPAPVSDVAEVPAVQVQPIPYSGQSISQEPRLADRDTPPVIDHPVSETFDNRLLPPKEVQKGPDDRQKRVSEHTVTRADTGKPSEPASAKMKTSEEPLHFSPVPPSAPAEMPDQNKIYKLRELPQSVQQNLPLFSITALMYSSNPASRMARINEQMMYEGQDLTAGIKLEEIAKDGVIFSHQNFRFWVGLK